MVAIAPDPPVHPDRSRLMRSVRQKNSAPEIRVRSALHRAGYRFRLHRRDLPGSPDIVLPRHRIAIFVHGCFWHRHAGCKRATEPKTRVAFWSEKFRHNVERDARAWMALQDRGWIPVVVWECETMDSLGIVARVLTAIQSRSAKAGHTAERTGTIMRVDDRSDEASGVEGRAL